MSDSAISLVTASPSVQIVTATKPVVDALLSMNVNNRRLRATHVAQLVDEMKRGAFMLTASGIGVSREGILTDGQHRLVAIREAGYPPVQFVLCTGLDPKSQAVVDRHAKRSFADALTLVQGRTVSTHIVAANNALLSTQGSTSRDEPFRQRGGAQASDAEATQHLSEWWDDLTAVIEIMGGEKAGVVAAIAVYHRHEPEKALAFAQQVRKGVELREDAPAYRLREALKAMPNAGGGVNRLRAFCLTASACINHAAGRELKMLKAAESWARKPWKGWSA